MITVYEYNKETKEFEKAGFAQTAKVFFQLMKWKGLTSEYENLINKSKNIYFYLPKENQSLFPSLGIFHWDKQGFLDEYEQKKDTLS